MVLMANSAPNSGQQGFPVGSEGEMDLQSIFSDLDPLMSSDPLSGMSLGSLSVSDIWELLQSPTNTVTQFNSQQHDQPQPAGTNMGMQFNSHQYAQPQPAGTNMVTQFNSQQYAQPLPAGTSSGVVHNQHLTNIDVSRTGTPDMIPEKILKKRKADRDYRERKKQAKAQMQNDLGRLNDEKANLRKENESLKLENAMNETLQSQAKMIDQLKSDLAILKSNNEMQNAIEQHLAELLKIKDFKKLIKEGYSTQDPYPSDGKRHSEQDILAGTEHVVLDVDDSGGENDDSKRKKKRAAPSAPSGCRSVKVPKLEVMDELMETPQVTLAVKKECCDTRAEVHGFIHPPSVTECLRILKGMGGIQYSTLKKAKALFESPSEREFFAELTEEEWRREWVKDLEKDA